jgi:hypothetical protein
VVGLCVEIPHFLKEILMSKTIARFSFCGTNYPIVINWTRAYNDLPSRFEIDILSLFVNDTETEQTALRILVDDNLLLKVCWYFLEPQVNYTWEKFLTLLDDEPEAIENFREVFWGAIVNFSSPQKRGVLVELWNILKKRLKQLSLESRLSEKSPSDSNQEESE